MRIFATTPEDDKNSVMRLELSARDIEVLEEGVDRLRRLVTIEDALDVKGFVSPYITGNDLPTLTGEVADLLEVLVKGWDAEAEIVYEVND